MISSPVFGALSLAFTLLAAPAIGQHNIALFESELAAAVAAANNYNPLSIRNDREYMGAIFRSGNQYGYSVTAGKPGSDEISIRISKLHWPKVVAFWHTHGNTARVHRYFSDVDTALVNRHGKPFYLADYTGYLKVFRPGDTLLSPHAAGRLGLPNARGFATGEVVRDQYKRTIKVAVQTESEAS